MHKRATVREAKLPHVTLVTPSEGSEGTDIPPADVVTTEFHRTPFAIGLPAHLGIAPWDALWARSNVKPH